jgi:hypothetical protein
MNDLTDLLNEGERFARHMLLEAKRELLPSWIVCPANGEIGMIVTPFEDSASKKRVVRGLRKMFQKLRVKSYCFLCEVYTGKATTPFGSPLTGEGSALSASDRGEAVIICAATKDNYLGRMLDIRRDWNDQVIALELKEGILATGEDWVTQLL